MRLLSGSLLSFLVLFGAAPRAEEPTTLQRAQRHYQAAVSLFEAGNKEQALVEFQLANEIAPKPENTFMIAQCEYHLGHLVNARAHYEAYLAEQATGELAELSRFRIDAINRRPGVFVINTVPDAVDVRIEGEGKVITGQAPNEFPVPRGKYRVTAGKPNFVSETRDLAIEVAETKPLFFKLEPIAAHLTVRTKPSNAALFVRGNRAQNPYAQAVAPGTYEIYAEASYYEPRRETITLAPGEKRVLDFPLNYVQRSGRPELIGFWTGIGAAGGGLAVLTQADPDNLAAPLSIPILATGMLAGGLGLGVLSSTTALVPDYIRDNLALFRIGAMWIGDVEGAALAMALTRDWTPTFLGGVAGLTAGAFVGWWLDDKAPNYGRVALIESAALLGAMAGAIAVPALGLYPSASQLDNNQYRNQAKERLAWGMLAGLNVGLGAGLVMAYLPDQRSYGPTWQRVLMVDLAGLTGAVFASAIELCTRTNGVHCANDTDATLDKRTARFALVGAGLGVFAGWLLTMNYDRESQTRSDLPPLSFLPLPGAVPVQSTVGTADLVPGLLSQGRF
ncbi:MAG: PEGA domain-containing protein [Deltaproteobacteria bacterium]|nr:PEGA domain-containing protein [Deltaproteobacteria bacterium]